MFMVGITVKSHIFFFFLLDLRTAHFLRFLLLSGSLSILGVGWVGGGVVSGGVCVCGGGW